ncbi:hypothetical protein BGZ94_003879 [Podila epigama]|nr:hypothetical protein BGZ94_003879 [Podila epigama]
MNGHGFESAVELDSRFREKVEARKRGAGTHQPKFRGFSLAKSSSVKEATDKTLTTDKTASDKTERESIRVGRPASTPASLPPSKSKGSAASIYTTRVSSSSSTTTTAASRHSSTQVKKSREQAEEVETRSITESLSTLSVTKSIPSPTGLNDRYKERVNARIRGAGSGHQTDFRGFTIKPTKHEKPTEKPGQESLITTTQKQLQRRVVPGRSIESSESSARDTIITLERKVVASGYLNGQGQQRDSLKRRIGDIEEDFMDQVEANVDLEGQGDGENDVQHTTDSTQDSDFQKPTSRYVKDTRLPPRSKTTGTKEPRSSSMKTVQKQGKRRRMIEEEVNENENPTTTTSESLDALEFKSFKTGSTSKMASKEKSVAKQRTTLAESDRNATSKETTTSKNLGRFDTEKGLKQTKLVHLGLKSKEGAAENRPLRSVASTSKDSDYSELSDDAFEASLSSNKKTLSKSTQNKGKEAEKEKSKGTTASSLSSSSSREKSSKGKGSTDSKVKVYKQLQIQCLKFLGPSTSVSKPATVRNPDIAKQLPVPGEATSSNSGSGGGNDTVEGSKKLVQGVLQIEQAPLSEMDVISEAVREVDLLDDHTLLRASVKKAEAVKKELRVRLLETQRQRHKVREELKRVRVNFEREERARRRLEETHQFLTDLEALRDQAEGIATDEEKEEDAVKTGLQSFIATVSARSCHGNLEKDKSGRRRAIGPEPGALGALQDFNRLVESLTQ